jgi:DNA (cytosine-5)-methyltransferase 1
MSPVLATADPAVTYPTRAIRSGYTVEQVVAQHRTAPLTCVDFFSGIGGSGFGVAARGLFRHVLAANHWDIAIDSHALNFPHADHERGDIHLLPLEGFPSCDFVWFSPECTAWSNARGVAFDFGADVGLFSELEPVPDEATARSRALMSDVPRYLRAMRLRGQKVKAGVVENVPDVRNWAYWDAWVREIQNEGYKTRLVAYNSMHAQGTVTSGAPQSRNRLYLCLWDERLPDPDFRKWLDPYALCTCGEWVQTQQVFKRSAKFSDMGRYGKSYECRSPHIGCRNPAVEPPVLPAAACIDWSNPGTPIGSRRKTAARPQGLKPKTIVRIAKGLELDALIPWVIPLGYEHPAHPVTQVGRTQTTRQDTGLAWLPFVLEMRGGSSDYRSIRDRLATVTAQGNDFYVVSPPELAALSEAQRLDALNHLLIPYNRTGVARRAYEPTTTFTTKDRLGLARPADHLDEVLFRMFTADEIAGGMAFPSDHRYVDTSHDNRVTMYGNAVTPPVAELLSTMMAEVILGVELERYPQDGTRDGDLVMMS